MNTLVLILFGVIMGSFINALVWRLRQQLDNDGNYKKLSAKKKKELSIFTGRSMCPHCKHQLDGRDLVPLFSWLQLRGKCRYCKSPISAQYPLVELLTALLFATSYIFWPYQLINTEWIVFFGWLTTLTTLIALAVYDARWYILPSRLIYTGLSVYFGALLINAILTDDLTRLGWAVIASAIYFGLFYAIFVTSYFANKNGKSSKDWLGYGDVRLAALLGLIAGTPTNVFIAVFLASVIGLIIVTPSLVSKKISVTAQIPFGPFLIAGAVLAMFFGAEISNWYNAVFLGL